MNELKPCPMCGGSPNKPAKNGGSDERSGYNFTVTVACKCGLRIDRASHQGKQGWCDDSGQAEAEAIAAWNSRAQPAAQALPSITEQQSKWGRLYTAANALVVKMGFIGSMQADSTEMESLKDKLHDLDGGEWMPGLMPPAQPAAPSVCSSCDGTGKISGLPCAWCMQSAAPSVAPEPTTIMWTICRMALMVNPSEAMIHQVKRLASASEGIAQQQLSALALRAEQAQSKPHVIARPVSPLAWQGSCSCPKCGEAQSTPYDASEICSKCALATTSVAPEPPDGLCWACGIAINTSQPLPVAPEPVAWTLQSELDAAQTTCSAHLWFTNPRNSAWTALFTREQIAAHPPRAPLTEEQIIKIARTVLEQPTQDGKPAAWQLAQGIARAVEAAHGIGGK